MFNSKKQLSKELYDTLQSTELTQQYIEQNGFNLKDLEISKARIQGVKAKDFSFSNIFLKNYDSRNSSLENGVFKDIEFDDVYFNESIITNVIFENSNLMKVNFFGVNFTNVKFINCKITKSTFFELIDSDIEFIGTKIYDNEYKFSDSQIQVRIINSEFRDTDMMSLKEGSSIYIENSVIDTVSFQYSKLTSFKSINSKLINSTLGSSEINELTLDKSLLDISFGDAKINKVSVSESKIDNLGAISVTVNDFEVTSCDGPADISFSGSNINHISIKDCDFSALAPSMLTGKSLLIENATIIDSSFYKSNIGDFILRNVSFIKKAKFKKFTAQNTTIEKVTKAPELELIMDGANIEF